MIVRVMGEGQFEVDDEVAKGLNELDAQAAEALEAGDAERLTELLRRMADAVRLNGARLPDEIAVAIAAEMVAWRKRGAAHFLTVPGEGI